MQHLPATLHCGFDSSITIKRPVFFTDSRTVSLSHGDTERKSITSTETLSSANSLWQQPFYRLQQLLNPHLHASAFPISIV